MLLLRLLVACEGGNTVRGIRESWRIGKGIRGRPVSVRFRKGHGRGQAVRITPRNLMN